MLEDPAGLVLGAERGVARVLAGAGHARVGQRALRVRRAAHRGRACDDRSRSKQTADKSKQTADSLTRAAQLAHRVDGQLVLAGAHRRVRPHHAPLMVGAALPDARVYAGPALAGLGDEAVGVGAASTCLGGKDCH